MNLLRRFVGVVLLLTGITGLALSALGIVYGHQLVDQIGDSLEESLSVAAKSLDTTEEALLLAKKTVGQVNTGLETVESAALDVSRAISETRPLLNQVSQVVSRDVPDSVEALQTAVPGLSQSAAFVDRALTTLSNLRIRQTVFGIPVDFDLNMVYAPKEPFEHSVDRMGDSLEGVAPRLRDLQAYMDITNDSLIGISQDIVTISSDLDTINRSVAEVTPLLNDSVQIVAEMNDLIRQTQGALFRRLNTVKLMVTLAMIWISLSQLAPLYLGWELAAGQRGVHRHLPDAATELATTAAPDTDQDQVEHPSDAPS